MRPTYYSIVAVLISGCLHAALPAFAISVNPVAIGGVYDSLPFSGAGDVKESTPFIGNNSNRRESAVFEFDLTSALPGVVNSATLTGGVFANNSINTGTRIHNVDVYAGNGTVDVADYNIAATRIGTFAHASGGSTNFNLDAKTFLQSLLDGGNKKLGARISPGTDPQGFDVLVTTSPAPALNYSLTPYGSTTITKSATADAAAQLSGGTYALDTTTPSIWTQNFPFANVDRRGIIEFSLSGIPTGSNITGAKLTLDVVGTSSSPPDYPSVPIYGYAGNGATETADATQTANKIGHSDPVTSLDVISIELNGDYVEALLGTATHLGLLLLGSANNDQFAFASREASSSFTRPTLELMYLPPVGDYNSSGSITTSDYTTWRSQFGVAGVSVADGNTNGVVDAADYVVWRKRLSGPASGAGAAVPEPHLVAIFLTAAVVASISRCRDW